MSGWISDDITFCLSDCDDLDCERNSKHIRCPEIPHSYANFEGNEDFCNKVIKERKEYMPGVWYGADVEPPEYKNCVVVYHSDEYVAYFTKYKTWRFRTFDGGCMEEMQSHITHWMLIPEPPKE